MLNRSPRTLISSLLCALLLLCVTSIPYYKQAFHPPEGTVFSGFFVYPKDMHSYGMWLRQASQGHWLFRDQYEPVPHPRGYFNICWNLFGHLGGALNLSLPETFQLMRWGSVFLLVGAFVRLSYDLIEEKWIRRCMISLFGLGGSYGGWLLLLNRGQLAYSELIHRAADLWSPIHPFFSIMFVPHFSFALAWFLLANTAWLAGKKTKNKSLYLTSTLCIMIAGLTHPFEMLTFGATVVGVTFLERAQLHKEKQDWYSLIPLLGVFSVVLYDFWLTHLHPVFRIWRNASGGDRPLWLMLTGGGPVLWVGLLELLRLIQHPRHLEIKERWLLVWGSLSLVLLYSRLLPNAFGFSTSMLLPHYFLAGRWLSRFWKGSGIGVRMGILLVTLGLTVTSLCLLWQASVLPETELSRALFARNKADLYQLFVPLPVKGGMEWLGEHAGENEVILGAWETLLQIPTYSDAFVFVGHKDMSSDRTRKKEEIEQFFDRTTSNGWRKEFLIRERIAYVFWGPKERALGAFQPATLSLLNPVYSTEGVVVYSVKRPH